MRRSSQQTTNTTAYLLMLALSVSYRVRPTGAVDVPDSQRLSEALREHGEEAIPQVIEAITTWGVNSGNTKRVTTTIEQEELAEPFDRAVRRAIDSRTRWSKHVLQFTNPQQVAALLDAYLVIYAKRGGPRTRSPFDYRWFSAADGQTALQLLQAGCLDPGLGAKISFCYELLKAGVARSRKLKRPDPEYLDALIHAVRQLEQMGQIGLGRFQGLFIRSTFHKAYPVRIRVEVLAAWREHAPELAEKSEEQLVEEANNEEAIAELKRIAVEEKPVRLRVEAVNLLVRLGRHKELHGLLLDRLKSGISGPEQARARFTLRLLKGLRA